MHTKFPASLTRKRFAARTVPPVAPLPSTAPSDTRIEPPAARTESSGPRVSRRIAPEIASGRAAIFAVVVGWAALLAVVVLRPTGIDDAPWSSGDRALSVAGASFCAIALLCYLAARQGALIRLNEHVRVPRRELERHFTERQNALTVLVAAGHSAGARTGSPALRASLWSAALQEYPTLRVVLLLDASSEPSVQAEALMIVRRLTDALAEPRARFEDALFVLELELAWDHDVTDAHEVAEDLIDGLASDYRWAVAWLARQRLDEAVTHASSAVFTAHTLGGPAADFARIAADLDRAISEHIPQTPERMLRLQRRLAWTFSAELEIFDGSLAGYVDQIGAAATVAATGDVFETDYLLTLGPDAQLLNDYCLRSIYFLDEPEHSGVAVVQTPSFPQGGPRTGRFFPGIRGLLHHGASRYGASFWVGSTALIRTSALGDFRADRDGGVAAVTAETDAPRGVAAPARAASGPASPASPPAPDSVSAVDLGVHGWTLANFPERLSFSPAAPGFGSVIVQRRRTPLGDAVLLRRIWRQLCREFGAGRSAGGSGRSPRRVPR